jgi:carbon storage regulator CsrA
VHGIEILIVVDQVRNGNRVRLGFTAPPEVAIHRREVHEAIMREHKQKDGE